MRNRETEKNREAWEGVASAVSACRFYGVQTNPNARKGIAQNWAGDVGRWFVAGGRKRKQQAQPALTFG